MENNDIPDNKVILKRAGVVLVLVVFLAALVIAKEHIFTVICVGAVVLGIYLMVLFIRLCNDVHIIAMHISENE